MLQLLINIYIMNTFLLLSPFEQFKLVELFHLNYNFVFSNGMFQLSVWILLFTFFSIFLLYGKKKNLKLIFFINL